MTWTLETKPPAFSASTIEIGNPIGLLLALTYAEASGGVGSQFTLESKPAAGSWTLESKPA